MGYETTKELARRGARVIMLCHELKEGKKVAKQIGAKARVKPRSHIEVLLEE